MRAPASRRAGARARAMSTCAPCSSAPPLPPRGPRAPTSRTSSTASRPAAARCARLSPSLTRSSWLPITCLPRACLTANSEKPTSTRSPRSEPSPTSNDVSSASATTSPSNQRPSPHDPSSPLKLFSWQRKLRDASPVRRYPTRASDGVTGRPRRIWLGRAVIPQNDGANQRSQDGPAPSIERDDHGISCRN